MIYYLIIYSLALYWALVVQIRTPVVRKLAIQWDK